MVYIPYATGPRSIPFSDMSRQLPTQKRSRFLIRQAPLKSISDTERVSYLLEIQEYLLPNGMQTGRVFVMKDRFRKDSRVIIPLELCEELRKQLLSCAESSLGNSAFQNAGAAAAAADGTTTNASTQQQSGPKIFDLSKLNSVEIKNEQLNFQFAIGSVPPGSADIQVSEKSRRWISTSPLVPNTQDGATAKFDPSQQWMPWNDSGSIEIYEPLIPDLLWFLMDAAIRYRTIDTPPTMNALYSMSGDRRFYFDLRTTRWGHRLFLSQVTDLHRNVIAIPVETLTDFRDRINTFIEKLNLEDNKNLRDTLQVHSVPQRYWKRHPKIRPNFINGAYAPTRPPTYLDDTPVAAEAAVGAPIGTFTPPTNVERTRQISSSKGNSKSRTRTISRTSNTATADASSHRTRQISTSSKGASRPASQPNNQPKDGTHRRQTPNKQHQHQQQQQQSQQQKQQPQEQQQPQAPKDRSPNSNHAAQQAGGAPQFSRNKDRSDQQNAAQPKPIPSSSRPQQQQQQQRQPHWQQTSRQRQPNANRSAQQSGKVSGGPRGKALNAPGEAHDPPPRIPQSAPKPQQQQQQQQNRSQAPTAWNQTAQRATLEVAEVSNRPENAPGASAADDRTKPQHPAPEQKAQQGQNQQRPLDIVGGGLPAGQRPVPTVAAAASAPTDSAKLEQPKPQQQQQKQNAPIPASNAPRSPHGSAQQTQGQTTPQQPRGQQQMIPKQELKAPNVASGEEEEEEEAEQKAAAVTAEETAASASVPEQASAAEANTVTARKLGKKGRSKKKRAAGAGDSGQGKSEPSKEENGKVEGNAQEPVAV